MAGTTTCRRCASTIEKSSPVMEELCATCFRSIVNVCNAHNKRARRKNYMGRLRPLDWLHILLKYDFRCASCGVAHHETKGSLTLDHKFPLAKGGCNLPFNVQPLCHTCHRIKDGDPNVSPWDVEKVLALRDLRSRSRKFMSEIQNQFINDRYGKEIEIYGIRKTVPMVYDDLRNQYEKNMEDGSFNGPFGSFVIETLLDFYMEKKNAFQEA